MAGCPGRYSLKMQVKTLLSPGICLLLPGLLQLRVLRHLGRTGEPVSVGLECRRPSGYWYPTFRPHNTGAPSDTMATSMTARRLQCCDARSLVALWHFVINCCLVVDAHQQ